MSNYKGQKELKEEWCRKCCFFLTVIQVMPTYLHIEVLASSTFSEILEFHKPFLMMYDINFA
ncbi:hypothetical protein RDI58_001368 [Solanum bulbocastanum]|uniref:Uncharacterized protein n=1 Tax=Solanum bulbocastanum TaxID=147425 RepID=A0AAN8U517_SOLBU